MMSVEIQIINTKNPAILKFMASEFLVESGNYEFKNIEEAKPSPLAQQLFYLPFVKTVFISSNFIAVEKYDIVSWEEVQEELSCQIKEFLDSGSPIITELQSTYKTPVSVYVESTPNPEVMKFVANKPLVKDSIECKDYDQTLNIPLAQELFNFPFVKELFFDQNYVSITKYATKSWDEVAMELRAFLTDYLNQGKPIVSDEYRFNAFSYVSELNSQHLDETSKQICEILDEYVRPAVASDGGNILFESYDLETKTVKVLLQGACSGCPSSTITLKNGIENILQQMMAGKVLKVEAVNL